MELREGLIQVYLKNGELVQGLSVALIGKGTGRGKGSLMSLSAESVMHTLDDEAGWTQAGTVGSVIIVSRPGKAEPGGALPFEDGR